MEFVYSSDETFLVVTPDPTSLTDAYAVLKALNSRLSKEKPTASVKMLANKVGSYAEGQELYNKLQVVVNRFLDVDLDYLGAIPQDMLLSKAVLRQTPVSLSFPRAVSSKALYEVATMIHNNKVLEQSKPGGVRLLFYNLIQSKVGR
jgi:flagellar biosynthesis protein FlhG